MHKLFTIAVTAMITGGCSTPMERAQQLCNEFGDPSPACIERRFDIERKNEAEFQKQFNDAGKESPTPSSQPAKSGYDRMLQQLREDCQNRGGKMIGQSGCEIR